ncbi:MULTISPECIES: rhodanese-related sulfurtransferase [Rhodomicrobium]|uniref:oxygen-dependent tRNA uridine(34) hydroxylase TrhO n=1 Tax=Rhodomicrobium TaxID=1068 RepID=UPI000B4C1B83|nr:MULTISPECIES: rhodanese-related sulfurtransferase [Rhodomicrobium]
MSQIVVAALYKFTPFADLPALKASLEHACAEAGILGTLILAPEGINGTVAGSRAGIDALLGHIRAIPGCGDLDHKESFTDTPPFYRMKIRLKREIVTMGVPGIDPNRLAGTYVEPQDWNALIADPEVVLIDTRNDYEARIGSFPGAIDPQTTSFGEFPDWFDRRTDLHGKRKFAMFCTGGIRCEKATAFLRLRGFDEVYHLKGGILKYLETVPEHESLWHGECFVFDQRTTLAHGNAPGSYEICHACRNPVSEADRAAPGYIPGVSCPHCADALSEDQKRRFAERQRQVELAERRGVGHIGVAPEPRAKRRA